MDLRCHVNGIELHDTIPPGELLLSFLRRHRFWGVKEGCETGECGACLVLVDGVPRMSCVMLAGQAQGRSLTTIEGLGTHEHPHPLQTAFHNAGAIQCGYCTPAMILAAKALLDRVPSPSESQVRDALAGTLCRCTGYKKPVEAILAAAPPPAPEGEAR